MQEERVCWSFWKVDFMPLNKQLYCAKMDTRTQPVIETIEEKPAEEEDLLICIVQSFYWRLIPAVEPDIKSYLNGVGDSMVIGCAGSY